VLSLHVRFEVPSGVKIATGVVLGANTQLAPGTVLHNELEVLERPHGVVLQVSQNFKISKFRSLEV